MTDNLIQPIAKIFSTCVCSLDNSICFMLSNPSNEVFLWFKKNPPDYYLQIKYNSYFEYLLVICAWKNHSQSVLFKLTFSHASQYSDKKEIYTNKTVLMFFEENFKECRNNNWILEKFIIKEE